MNNPTSLLDILQSVVGPSHARSPISLHEPDFKGTRALEYVADCVESGWVSSNGSYVSRFESDLASFAGSSHSVAVSNGTVGLRLALHCVGVEHNTEVLMPPLSFVATANAVSHLGAVPHFIDIDPQTLALSPLALRQRLEEVALKEGDRVVNRLTGRRISALVVVHVFGNPAEMLPLQQVAAEWGLPLVEDAAEALGSFYQGTHCGLHGDVGVLSFNGNKLITTGGGGALLTNNPELASRAKHLSTTAKLPHSWEFNHDDVAWNDRMPNINAALGCAQLELLSKRLSKKRVLFSQYEQSVNNHPYFQMVQALPDAQSNYWLISLRLNDDPGCDLISRRDQLLRVAHDHGYLLRPVWTPLHLLPMYQDCPSGALTAVMDEYPRLISLPSSPQLAP